MTNRYTAEQSSPDSGGRGMNEDVIPWLETDWHVDTILSEFPYFQYAGPEDSPEIQRCLEQYGCSDIWTLPDHLRESATYRTDLVAARVDPRRVAERKEATDHLRTLITSEGWGDPQPVLRAFLNFRRDGPMTRTEYVREHGLRGEPNGQPEDVSQRVVDHLIRRGYLADLGDGTLTADAFGTVFGTVHAVELKREPREWETALEQAQRADCYADFLWVVMSESTVQRAREHRERFQSSGVGLAATSPRGGVRVLVQPERKPHRERTHELLSRPHCERWNLNERVLDRYTPG